MGPTSTCLDDCEHSAVQVLRGESLATKAKGNQGVQIIEITNLGGRMTLNTQWQICKGDTITVVFNCDPVYTASVRFDMNTAGP